MEEHAALHVKLVGRLCGRLWPSLDMAWYFVGGASQRCRTDSNHDMASDETRKLFVKACKRCQC